jgi:hypothetical protein
MIVLVVALTMTLSVTPEKDAVVAAVQQFFDTMAAKDIEGAAEVLAPDGQFFSIRTTDGEQVVRRSTNREYLERLASSKDDWLERMWEPEVRIRGDVATVWAPYDFFVNSKFSHCGYDAFQLMKIDGRWMITGGSYTVEVNGCEPSPLGPPDPNPPWH